MSRRDPLPRRRGGSRGRRSSRNGVGPANGTGLGGPRLDRSGRVNRRGHVDRRRRLDGNLRNAVSSNGLVTDGLVGQHLVGPGAADGGRLHVGLRNDLRRLLDQPFRAAAGRHIVVRRRIAAPGRAAPGRRLLGGRLVGLVLRHELVGDQPAPGNCLVQRAALRCRLVRLEVGIVLEVFGRDLVVLRLGRLLRRGRGLRDEVPLRGLLGSRLLATRSAGAAGAADAGRAGRGVSGVGLVGAVLPRAVPACAVPTRGGRLRSGILPRTVRIHAGRNLTRRTLTDRLLGRRRLLLDDVVPRASRLLDVVRLDLGGTLGRRLGGGCGLLGSLVRSGLVRGLRGARLLGTRRIGRRLAGRLIRRVVRAVGPLRRALAARTPGPGVRRRLPRTRDRHGPAGKNEVGIGEPRPARLLRGARRLEHLRVLGPVAELLLGDPPQGVARLDDDLGRTRLGVRDVDRTLGPGGALRGPELDGMVRRTGLLPVRRLGGQLQHPARLDPVPGVERAATCLLHAVVQVGDLLEPRAVTQGLLGDPPQRVARLHRVGGRRRLVGRGTLARVLGRTGNAGRSSQSSCARRDRPGHHGPGLTGLDRLRRGHRRRHRRRRDQHRDHRADKHGRGTLLRPEPAHVRRTATAHSGDHLDHDGCRERQPRDPADDLDQPEQYRAGHVGAAQRRDDPVEADGSGPYRSAEHPQPYRDPDDERDQQQHRAEPSHHACARASPRSAGLTGHRTTLDCRGAHQDSSCPIPRTARASASAVTLSVLIPINVRNVVS